MLIVLAGVVGVIYLIFFLLKKGAKRRFVENDLIEIIGSKDVAGGKSLHIVKIGSMFMLIGVAEGGINLISEITDKETVDAITLKLSEMSSMKKKGFQNTLSDLFGVRTEGDSIVNSLEFIKKQRSRLDRLKR